MPIPPMNTLQRALCAFLLLLSSLPGWAATDPNSELINAAREGRMVAARSLLAQGADVNASNPNGKTPLMAAAFYGNTRIVRLLLSEGADVNAKDKSESTALMAAIFNGNISIVKDLIAEGADVNVKNKAGLTPLKRATAMEHKEIAKLLEASGAEGEDGGGKKKKKRKVKRTFEVVSFSTNKKNQGFQFLMNPKPAIHRREPRRPIRPLPRNSESADPGAVPLAPEHRRAIVAEPARRRRNGRNRVGVTGTDSRLVRLYSGR